MVNWDEISFDDVEVTEAPANPRPRRAQRLTPEQRAKLAQIARENARLRIIDLECGHKTTGLDALKYRVHWQPGMPRYYCPVHGWVNGPPIVPAKEV